MNAIKNTIVTITLLAVGYGAYVVLKSPPPHSLEDSEMSWDSEVEPGKLDAGDRQTAESAENGTRAASTAEDSGLLSRISAPKAVDLNPANNSASRENEVDNQPTAESVEQATTANIAPNLLPPVNNLADDRTRSSLVPAESAPPRDQTPEPSYYNRNPDVAASTAVTDDPINPDVSPASEAFQAAWAEAQGMLANGQLAEALQSLSRLYRDKTLASSDFEQVADLLDQLAGSVIYSDKSYLEPAFQVQDNESLDGIARKHGITVQFLAQVNGLDPNYRPVAGETLKVVKGPFDAEIDRQRGELTLFLGRNYAGRFKVSIGDDLPTNASNYEVIEKSQGREYFDRKSGYRVAKEDPNNPYGSVWIGLRGDQVTAGHNVGIHVSKNPNAGGGCIGVSEVDGQDLSAILSVGSKVLVTQ